MKTVIQLIMTITVLLPASVLCDQKVFVGNGNPNTDWNISSNWSPTGKPGPKDTVIIESLSAAGVPYVRIAGNAKASRVVIGSGGDLRFSGNMEKLTIYGDLVIEEGGTCSFEDGMNYPVSIRGDFTCNGSFTADSYTVDFNGHSNQTIRGSKPVQFYNLTVSNQKGITIDGAHVGVMCMPHPSDLSPTLVNGGTFTIGSPLPIQLAGFTATVVSPQTVRLAWQTMTETNNYGFNVERSYDNFATFDVIGFEPGHGTTLEPRSYSYDDAVSGTATAYYRLKQMDLDGVGYSYSEILAVEPSTTTGVAGAGSVPAGFRLRQNYPNPFNPSTQIEYTVGAVSGQLSAVSIVRLGVYDVLGREVAVLVNGAQAPGTYSVSWNAAGMPSGTYFYRLETATSSDVKKMVLAK